MVQENGWVTTQNQKVRPEKAGAHAFLWKARAAAKSRGQRSCRECDRLARQLNEEFHNSLKPPIVSYDS